MSRARTTDEHDGRARAIGRLIRQARSAKGWNQHQLAEALTAALDGEGTVTQSSVSYWETGRSVPAPDKLPVLERVLAIKPRGELARLGYLSDGYAAGGPELDAIRRQLEAVQGEFSALRQAVEHLARREGNR